jgi:exosome complex RNA-binding protein Rrp4
MLHHDSTASRVVACTILTSVSMQYVVALEDMVIGVVLERVGESYKVDIGAAHNASLPLLAFEGASKKNRPNLVVRVSLKPYDLTTRTTTSSNS